MVSSRKMGTPVGSVVITASEKGITRVGFGAREVEKSRDREENSETDGIEMILGEAIRQLEEYFAGRRKEFTLPLDIHGSAFYMKAWEEMQKTPYGQVCTYKELARAAGKQGAARAAGQACRRNPIVIIIPCHRVLASGGKIGGYSGGLKVKEWLLELEKGK